MSNIKRIYTIQNKNTRFITAWEGYAIDKCWFSSVKRSFEIKLIQIDNWENSDKNLDIFFEVLNNESFDVLFVTNCYLASIQAILDIADYRFENIEDEYSYDPNYFYTFKIKVI
tara:strand:- start:221 stop:562 length:342 start_codon:yes stop_codon:yes gene_type:complete